MPFGLKLARQFQAPDSERDAHRVAAFKRMVAILDVIYGGTDHLHIDIVQQLQHDVGSFLAHYNWLGWKARLVGSKAYHITYKHHYLVHLAEDAKWINPRVGGCCLADEDFVGRMITICGSIMKGRHSTMLMKAFVEHYARALVIRWDQTMAYFWRKI